MKEVIDNFSTGGADYALYRPDSPQEVFDFLYSHVRNFDAAWDCGTGNGQVATKLAERFKTVFATDISEDQLRHAQKKANIIYRKERAEQTSFADNSLDLITVGQAIHWFDFDAFYKEVRRVARPGTFFAAWTYSLLRMTPAINKVIEDLYFNITHHYWDKQRYYVDAEYKTIPFPFEEITVPEMWIIKSFTLPELVGYLGTWSGAIKYRKLEQKNATDLVLKDIERAWGTEEKLEVIWPVYVRAGYVK